MQILGIETLTHCLSKCRRKYI